MSHICDKIWYKSEKDKENYKNKKEIILTQRCIEYNAIIPIFFFFYESNNTILIERQRDDYKSIYIK